MKIELYLRTIHQEHPDTKGRSDFANGYACRWPYKTWTKRWRRGAHHPNRKNTILGEHGATRKIETLIIRNEKFGGLIYDPSTTMVFKADKEGISTIQLLQKGHRLNTLLNAINVPRTSIKKFIANLKRFNLW